MKGIVADIQGKYAVVLRKDGSFIKVRNNGLYSIGCEMDIKKPSVINIRLVAKAASMAAGALLVMGLGYGGYSYTLPYSVVDVDINPSIEITTNIFDRIIKTEALNEDGRKLLQTGNLRHSSLDKGVEVLLNNAVLQGYLKEDATDNAIVFTVVTEDADRSEKLQKGIETVAATELEAVGVKSELVVGKATRQEHDSAKNIGLTQGKLNLIEKAIEKEPGLKLDDLKDVPVKDIMKKIKENRKEDKSGNKQQEEKQSAGGVKEDRQEKIQDMQDRWKNGQGQTPDIRNESENRNSLHNGQDNKQDDKRKDGQDMRAGPEDRKDSDRDNSNNDIKKRSDESGNGRESDRDMNGSKGKTEGKGRPESKSR